MKRLILFFFILLYKLSNAQIPEGIVQDSTLLRITDKIIDSLDFTHHQLGIITLHVKKLSVDKIPIEVPDERFGKATQIIKANKYELEVRFELNKLTFEYHIPDFYFNYRGRLVFVYTGSEFFTRPSNKSKSQIKRMIKGKMPKGGTFIPPTFWLEVKGNEFNFLRKGILSPD